jgi:hypothetical protein
MDHPISTTYLDVAVARASAALAAAGAYDATPTEMFCPGFKRVTLFGEYTRGGAGGAVNLKIEGSPVGTGDVWHTLTQYSGAVLALGSDSVSGVQREVLKYGSTGAAIEKFTVTVDLNGAVERLRVNCAESGAVGTPGTVKVTAKFTMGE